MRLFVRILPAFDPNSSRAVRASLARDVANRINIEIARGTVLVGYYSIVTFKTGVPRQVVIWVDADGHD